MNFGKKFINFDFNNFSNKNLLNKIIDHNINK